MSKKIIKDELNSLNELKGALIKLGYDEDISNYAIQDLWKSGFMTKTKDIADRLAEAISTINKNKGSYEELTFVKKELVTRFMPVCVKDYLEEIIERHCGDKNSDFSIVNWANETYNDKQYYDGLGIAGYAEIEALYKKEGPIIFECAEDILDDYDNKGIEFDITKEPHYNKFDPFFRGGQNHGLILDLIATYHADEISEKYDNMCMDKTLEIDKPNNKGGR